jgi:hypothetical protein
MPSRSKKQRRLDFEESQQPEECRLLTGPKTLAKIDYSFSKRQTKKDSLKESKIYEGILALIKHRYPE